MLWLVARSVLRAPRISVDHTTYPSDPARAASWSAALQRNLERQARGWAVVAAGLRAIGAATGQVLTGVPVGLGLGVLAVRVLGLSFTLPSPLLSIPVGPLLGLVSFMIATSAVALGMALLAVTRIPAASVLRAP